ncbi:serine-type carboxypeptidase, partial [Ascoidea rubescens DSM 1968]
MINLKICSFFLLFFKIFISLSISSPIDLSSTYKIDNDKFPGLQNIDPIQRPIMHAGHINLHKENDTNYFFWKFSKNNQLDSSNSNDFNRNNNLIIWLNGGPGCSSLDGALMEIGPLRLNKNSNTFYINNGSWIDNGDLVFIDQPANTGYSYSKDYSYELVDVSFNFMLFLKNYFKVFPNDINKNLYLTGESYSGQYIPYFANSILDHNEKVLNANKNQSSSLIDSDFNYIINLKSLIIGNGWIDPAIQSLSYLPFALQNKIVKKTDSFFSTLLNKHENCQKAVLRLNDKNLSQNDINSIYNQCEMIINSILTYTKTYSSHLNQDQCYNMYDIRLKDTYPSCGMNWPPDVSYIKPFLNNDHINIKKFLNFNSNFNKNWEECNNMVHQSLTNNNSPSSLTYLNKILIKIPIILYSGDKDIICNYIGTENLIDELNWNQQKGFSENTSYINWYYNNDNVGEIKSERNLTMIKIFGSSHMVPFDKPIVSRGLFDYATNNYEFNE